MLPERPADVDDVILQYFPQLAHVGDQCSVAVELGQAGRKIVSISTFRRLRIFMQRVGFQLHTVAVPIMSQLGVSLTNSRATTFSRLIWSSTRSEEHTSELQSLMRNPYAVFCLKKKKIKSI